MDSLDGILSQILAFRDERDWVRFHTPKNLAASMAVETAELQETMLWKSDSEVSDFIATAQGKTEVAEEIADVLIAALLLCITTGIEPITAIQDKLKKNATKYPSDLVKGKAFQHPQTK